MISSKEFEALVEDSHRVLSINEVAELSERSVDEVRAMAVNLGVSLLIKRRKHPEKARFIRDNRFTMTNEQIGNAIGCGKDYVSNFLLQNGLSRHNLNEIEGEEWFPLSDFPGYSISSLHRFKNDKKETLIKPFKGNLGIIRVALCNNRTNRKTHGVVARLIYKTFIDSGLPINSVVVPRDGNLENFEHSNLEAVTRSCLPGNRCYGENSVKNINSESMIIRMCEYLEEGLSVPTIAKRLNTDKATIYNVLKRNSWKHISIDYNFRNHPLYKDVHRQRIVSIFAGTSDAGLALRFNKSVAQIKELRINFS